MSKKKDKKAKHPKPVKKDFITIFAEKLKASGLGEVDFGALSDDSCRWVNLKIKDKELCFSFDTTGEKIERVGLYQDVVEIVDQKQLWTS
jgi:hypothetical protein